MLSPTVIACSRSNVTGLISEPPSTRPSGVWLLSLTMLSGAGLLSLATPSGAGLLSLTTSSGAGLLSFTRPSGVIVFEDRSSFASPIVLHFCNYNQQCRYCQNDQDGIWLFNGFLYFGSFFLKSSQFSFLFSLESIDASMSSMMY